VDISANCGQSERNIRGVNMVNDQTETKWTPGPWQVTQCRNGMPYVNVFRVSGPSDGTAPCTILFETKYETATENKANAHLIGAAPDMYKALERLLLAYQGGTAARSVQQQREDAAFAAATLAKAKGESSEIRQVSVMKTKARTLTKHK
jgi:hypothetical protein